MKQRFNLPVSNIKITAKRIQLVSVAVLLAITLPFQIAKVVKADDYDTRIAQIQTQIDGYQAQTAQLNAQTDSLNKEVATLDAQKKVIQAQIDINQVQHDKLVKEIADNQKKISDDQKALGNTIADLYLASNITPLEMLASSTSIADYVDKQTYQNTVRDSLATTITSIKKLKAQLEDQQKSVDRVIADQKFSQDALTAKQNEQEQLIRQTQGQEAAYNTLVAQRENQKLAVQQEQQAAIEAAIKKASAGAPINILPGDPNKGGYPWETGCYVDANVFSHGGIGGDGADPLGYGCRQCVSYVAWRVGQYTGNFPRYWGNANQWPASAEASGITTGSTPRVNSAGVISAGDYGHIVWIEAVNNDGTVDVSQYNYYNAGGPGWGNYSKMRVPASTYDTYIYF